MKPHPGVRKTIKWGGAAVTLLLVVLWLGSRWKTPSMESPVLGHVHVGGGVIGWSSDSLLHWTWHVAPSIGAENWVWAYGWGDVYGYHTRLVLGWQAGTRFTNVHVVLWFPALLVALPTACAWWLDARARSRKQSQTCLNCGYDRAGIAGDAKCPECGAMPKAR